MTFRKYQLERKIGEVSNIIKELTQQLETKKEEVVTIRGKIQETTKEKHIRKLEEQANREEAEMSKIQAELQKAELSYNQLKNEQSRMVYPTCSGCGNKGNIFVFQAVATETTVNEFQLTENIPTHGTGIVYCIKCGYIVGTVNRDRQ